MQHNSALFESLFNRNLSDAGNTGFLNELTTRHPYFSPAQFFLLYRVKDDEQEFSKQALKTNLFFNNAHWLHFQLKQTNPAVTAIDLQRPEQEIATQQPPVMDNEPDDTEAPLQAYAGQENETENLPIEFKMTVQKSNTATEAMLFEPMHMVDYFASQGIKLTDEVQMADKLGKQLKSFTEWLKTMKKIQTAEQTTPVHTDENVQVLAENSNTQTEVLTEAMAEVFAAQGKMDKAGEVYQKLSLLNPAKSTYFAAKLENLKGL